MNKLSIPLRVLLFAMLVSVAIPLLLWLIVQSYEWVCETWVTCDAVRPSARSRLPK